MASESLSRGVDLFFAQKFCFLKHEHGPPRGSKQAKTEVLLTTVLGSLRSQRVSMFIGVTPVSTAEIQSLAFGLVRRQATEKQKHTNASFQTRAVLTGRMRDCDKGLIRNRQARSCSAKRSRGPRGPTSVTWVSRPQGTQRSIQITKIVLRAVARCK